MFNAQEQTTDIVYFLIEIFLHDVHTVCSVVSLLCINFITLVTALVCGFNAVLNLLYYLEQQKHIIITQLRLLRIY